MSKSGKAPKITSNRDCLKYQEIVNNKNKALKLFTYIVYSKHMDVITPPLKSPTPSAYKHRCGQLCVLLFPNNNLKLKQSKRMITDGYGFICRHAVPVFFFPMSNIKTYLTVTLIYILNEVSKFFKCLKIAYRSEMRKILSQAFTDDLLSLYLVY